MKPIEKMPFKTKTDKYKYLNIKLTGLITSEEDTLSNISNSVALFGLLVDDINWAGYYFIKDGKLKLGPFYGKPACTTLTIGKGVCGTAVEQKEIQIVPDVNAFEGHVACDPDSKSEMVFPLIVENKVIGVLDIDSPIANRFDEDDVSGFQRVVNTLNKYIQWEAVL